LQGAVSDAIGPSTLNVAARLQSLEAKDVDLSGQLDDIETAVQGRTYSDSTIDMRLSAVNLDIVALRQSVGDVQHNVTTETARAVAAEAGLRSSINELASSTDSFRVSTNEALSTITTSVEAAASVNTAQAETLSSLSTAVNGEISARSSSDEQQNSKLNQHTARLGSSEACGAQGK
jgi:hypothetical protein